MKILKDYKSDPALKVIKQYRVANQNYSIAKRSKQTFEMNRQNKILIDCTIKARSLGFYIWINENGHTGHSYNKDYRATPQTDNDFEQFKRQVKTKIKKTISVVRMSLEE